MHTSLNHLNRCPIDEFSFLLRPVFDHSSWVAGAVAARRPFESRVDLLESLCAVVKNLDEEQQLALIREHHDLRSRNGVTAESSRESDEAGLDELDEDEAEVLGEVSQAYKMRFGFPFVICASKHDKKEILESMKTRLNNSREAEIGHALKQIYQIARIRLERVVVEGE
nr:2-oxo-4-hydroxy-4-carboxy-5-ureidoimidazoline decarboxylase [Phragmitibacter flavus]